MFDNIALWDFINHRPEPLHTFLWLFSDYGLPDGYRKINYFPVHVYELYNKKGEKFFAKFTFRTEQGLYNLTNAQASAIGIEDPNYFNRDLYNSIAAGNYPFWKLELDILTKHELDKLDYDPFDVTRVWKRRTYHTVTVGRLVMNKLVDNNFKDNEQSAFSPENLVSGILGPSDVVFKARKLFYPDTQTYRLGVNNANIIVNAPLYDTTYSRDGMPPVLDNMKDVPNYYPNSFNGPIPYVDESRPTERLEILHRNAVDLQPLAEFYNEIVESDAHRQRIIENFATSLVPVPLDVEKKALRLLTLVDIDLGRRVRVALAAARNVVPEKRLNELAQCIANVNQNNIVNNFKNKYT
ncbi:hypothetical protein PYW08_003387 [Mythimna loreyi]|uniref:Uncharacterized protein n=1 Tax=Mythimna loreyi TaxID=667449 RepID=A0ACC2QV85_9NEOP|nr:hypothetical protein PYW08_003387 [Mythimna loreyi]